MRTRAPVRGTYQSEKFDDVYAVGVAAAVAVPQSHLMKVAFEKYFLWKMRNGYVQLP